MKAAELNWPAVRHFAPDEWPAGVLEHVGADLILRVQEFRLALGSRLAPSPLRAGWVRQDGSPQSRHYIGGGRLSDAGDLFLLDANPVQAWLLAQSFPFGGIGLYLDTHYRGQPTPMMHFDLRPQRVAWLRVKDGKKRTYIYPARSAAERRRFFGLLALAA